MNGRLPCMKTVFDRAPPCVSRWSGEVFVMESGPDETKEKAGPDDERPHIIRT